MNASLLKNIRNHIVRVILIVLIAEIFWVIAFLAHFLEYWHGVTITHYDIFPIVSNIMQALGYMCGIYVFYVKKIPLNKKVIVSTLLAFFTFFLLNFIDTVARIIHFAYLDDSSISLLEYTTFILFNFQISGSIEPFSFISYVFWIIIITWLLLLRTCIKNFKK